MKVVIKKVKNGVRFEVEGGENIEYVGEKGEVNSRNFMVHIEMVVSEWKKKGYEVVDKR